jgi:tetratricopeptide (TPR) repeat protein
MQRIGRYEIRRELGRGGFGRVYAAFDPTVARIVAIKTLNAVDAPDLLARFRNEAATAGRLRHRNIVTIYDFGEHADSPFLVMELLDGEDLQSVIAKRRELSIYDKVRILWEVADGLQHAHANGIVHRDIKPANIMLLADRGVKLLDFGIALVAQEAMSRLTPQGNLIGTYKYMAPEQYRGGSTDSLADIFAYGIVCYELLTGTYPFQGADTAAVMYQIVHGDPPPLRERFPDCPDGLDAIVLRILAKDRDTRYQTLDDVKFDLEPILLELRRQRAAAVLAAAQAQFSNGDLEAAQGLVREALELDSGSAAARRLRDQIQQAIQRRAIRPKVAALIDTAERRLTERQFDEAIRDLESALRLDSTNAEVREKIQNARACRELYRRSEEHAGEAKRAFQERNLTGALEHANEALVADPLNAAAAALLDDIRRELDRRDRNRRLLDLLGRAEGLLLVQSHDEAIGLLENTDAELSGTTEAVEMLVRARADRLAHQREVRLLAEMNAAKEMMRRREFAAAAARLEILRAEFPATAEVRDLLEYALSETVAREKAAAEKRRAREDAPVAGRHLRDEGRFADAIEVLNFYAGRYGSDDAVRELLREIEALAEGERRCEGTETIAPETDRRWRVAGRPERLAAATVILLTVSLAPVKPTYTKPAAKPAVIENAHATGAVDAPLPVQASGTVRAREIDAKSRQVQRPAPVSRTVQTPVRPGEPTLVAAVTPRVPDTQAPAAPPDSHGLDVSAPATMAVPQPEQLPQAAAAVLESPRVAESVVNRPPDRKAANFGPIADTLKRFELALENRNIAQVEATWPTMPGSTRDSLKRSFRDHNVHYEVRLKPLQSSVADGDTAAIECERTAKTVVGSVAKPEQVTRVRILLNRTGETWVISGMEDLR